MRMIDQLVRFLAKILFNKETGEIKIAAEEIDSALRALTGLDLIFINKLSDKDIISLIKISEGDETAGVKYFITGKLLKEHADIKAEEMDSAETTYDYTKALNLLLEGILSSNENIKLFSDYLTDIDKIILKLKDADIPGETRLKLFKFYKLTGKLDKAGNELSILKKLNHNDIENEGIN